MDDLKSTYRKAVFIWINMVFIIFIFAFVVEIMKRNPAFPRRTSPLQEADLLGYILLGYAILTFFLIRFIHRQILSSKSPGNPSGSDSPLSRRIARLLKASVVTHSLCEAVASYGLVLFLFTNDPYDFYIFMLLSLIYFAFNFPGYAQWEEWIREADRKERSAILAPR